MTKTGECAIRMRISVNGTRIDSNTGKYIDPTLWNQSKERAKGTSKTAIDLNDYIDETNIKLFKLFQDMQSEGVCIRLNSSEMLRIGRTLSDRKVSKGKWIWS